MRTAQTPLTTGKLADTLSASTVTSPSTVFLYSSGYHTHHFAGVDNLVGIGILRWLLVILLFHPSIPT